MSSPPTQRPTPRVSAQAAYRRPPVTPTLLKLDANEGMQPPADLLEMLAERGPELLRRYPDVSALESRIASRLGVPAECVFVTAGADDAIERCCRTYLWPGTEILLSDPSFYLFARCAHLANADLVKVPWPRGPFPRQEFLDAVTDRTSVVAIVSPNNPTGTAATWEDVQSVAAAVPESLLVLDHAYVEYADNDLTARAWELPNVVILRTLSKAWGLAGCRVGYAVAQAELLGPMRAAGQPYAVAAPSAAMAYALLHFGQESVSAHIAQIKIERERFTAWVPSVGLDPYPSQGNFVLVGCGTRASFLHDALRAVGVAVRSFPDTPGLDHTLRVTMPGNEVEFIRLQRALEVCAKPEGLLLDLDVLQALSPAASSALRRVGERLPLYAITTRSINASRDGPAERAQRNLVREVVSVPGVAGAERSADSPPLMTSRALRDTLDRLGIGRAWVIGSTQEVLHAASGVGAVPIAMSSMPNRSSPGGRPVSGVVTDLTQLGEFLP